MVRNNKKKAPIVILNKTLTGINGFDKILEGGLPRFRPTIVCGNAGSGKTIMSMEFLVNGAAKYNEPGVFMSFEETKTELVENLETIHFNLPELIKKNKIYIEYLAIDKTQFIEAGKYDLEGLFVRLQNAITKMKAKRVVIDSLNALFYGLDIKVLRAEISRLFKWLKDKNVTAIFTLEIDNYFFTNDGLEQYVADCVVALDNRIINQIATRRIRVVKMRGSAHGNNEYPFIINGGGMSILPLISELQNQSLSTNRINSGITDLDGMLDGKGYFEGSSILVSGSAGTGKTSIAVSMVYANCKKKVRTLYCAFEESATQIKRNMNSIGLVIEPFLKSGVLKFYASRPTLQNLELHLISIKKIIEEFKPEIVILDPATNLMSEGINSEIRQMLTRFVDFLKNLNVTTLLTAAITLETIKSNPSDEGISSLVDTWILLRDIEQNGERNRSIYVLKSRGMNHSTQVREFVITNKGIHILPIYTSAHGILTGSAKLEHTLNEERKGTIYDNKIRNEQVEMERKRIVMEENIARLKTDYESQLEDLRILKEQNLLKGDANLRDQSEIIELRNNTDSSLEKSKKRNK